MNKIKKKKVNATLGAGLSFAMLATPILGAAPVLAAENPAPNPDGTVDIAVSGQWVGNEGDSINVSLLANGEKVDTATLDEQDGWVHTFENVAASNKSGDITYSITTKDLTDYKEHVSGSEQEGFDIVNLEKPKSEGFTGTSADIDVTASWIGDAGAQAEVALLVNGVEADTVTLTADNNWSYTFENMPVVEDDKGNPVTYSIAEKNIDGYDTIISGNLLQGFVISNIEASTDLIEGSVVVKYVDKNGNEIAYRTKLSGKVDTKYALDGKDIPGYKLVQTTGEDTGAFEIGVSEVVFTYEKVQDEAPAYIQGSIQSKFVNEKGDEIALREIHSGEIGTDYVINAKDINGYTLKEVADNPASVKGTYEKGITDVTFVYVPDKSDEEAVLGSIVTKYVDSDGNEIAPRTRISGEIGTDYKTELEKPEGYGLVAVNGDKSGTFEEGITIIEYVYDSIQDSSNDLVVKYLDESGNEIADRVTKSGEAASDYTTEQLELNGYAFAFVNGNTTGTLSGYPTVVQYVYADAVAESDVTVNYVDKNGNEIAKSVTLTGKVGSDYKTEQLDIDGYEFVKVKGEATGQYTKEATDVVYVYQEVVTESNVTVKYVDKNGNEIAKSVTLTGKVGTDYQTEQLDIDGYEFVKVKGEATGNYTKEATDVVYVYQEVVAESKLLVEYVDANGEQLAPSVTTTAKVGSDYSVEAITIDGYELINTKGSTDGAYAEDTTLVRFVYAGVDEPTDEPKPDLPTDEDVADGKDDQNNDPGDTNNKDTVDTVKADLAAAYNNVEFGMTYDEVVDIIGAEGTKEVGSSVTLEGETVANSSIYAWVTANGDYLSLGFTGDGLVLKTLTTDEGTKSDSKTVYVDDEGNIVDADVADGKADQNNVTVADVADGKTEPNNVTDADVADGKADQKMSLNATNKGENTVKNAETNEQVKGKKLANTATNTYNMLAIGAGALLAAGAGLFFMNRRRRESTDSE